MMRFTLIVLFIPGFSHIQKRSKTWKSDGMVFDSLQEAPFLGKLNELGNSFMIIY